MKIALVTNDFLPKKGGITNVIVNVGRKLTELGEKVFIFNRTCENKENLYFKVLSNTTSSRGIITYHVKFFYFLFSLFFRILFLFNGIKFRDKLKLALFYCFYPKLIVSRIISIKNLVFQFKTQKFNIILSGAADISLLYSFILSKWFDIPLVTIAHGDDFLRRYPYKINEFILQNIQRTVVTNKFMRRLFLKVHNIDPNKVKVIHLGVNIEDSIVKESIIDLRKKFNISPNEFVILTVSRFYPRKGFDTILNSIKLIIDENLNLPIQYIIIGSGEDENRIKKLISDLNIKSNVKLLGSVDEKVKNQYYKLSDVFILVPEVKRNSIEGFGIVYIEANFFKLPVIGARSGGVRTAIEDGKSGFLIEPKDIKSLKDKIVLLYRNKQLRKDLGQFGHERVKESFNWTKNTLIYQNVLKNVVREYFQKEIN